jgi:hypothetical protein
MDAEITSMLEDKRQKIPEGVMRGSNFTRRLTYEAETTSANGWPDGRYRMAGAELRTYTIADAIM